MFLLIHLQLNKPAIKPVNCSFNLRRFSMKNRSTIFVLAAVLLLLFSGFLTAQTEPFDFLFNCELEVQISCNFFTPGTDTLDVRGSFNGWAGPTTILSPNVFNPTLYQTTDTTTLATVGGEIQYKYVITNSSGTNWENVTGGGNRIYVTDGTETDLNGDGIKDVVLDTVFWSDLTPDDVFQTETDIVFEVDMRSAHAFLADSGAITFPVGSGNNVTGVDTVYLASGAPNTTPTMAWVWDLPLGDPLLDSLLMNDDGVNGDMVAGDSIWSLTVTFHVCAPKVIQWKHGVGGPFDNEADFAENHEDNVDKPNGRVRRCFGYNSVGGSNWYAPYVGSMVSCIVGIEPVADNELPRSFDLRQNYPNPFNPNTTIEFSITQKSDVKLTIYNLLGEEVITLVNEAVNPGTYRTEWDGTNAAGQKVTSGVYLYRLTAGNFAQTQKMMLMK
jgi:hypothetical protein